jgi:outer membrane protein assembly factor BamB
VDGETGQLVWSESYSTLYNERLVALACDPAGDLYVVGRAFGDGFYDLVVQKYYGDSGIQAWSREFGSAAILDDIGWDLVIDSQGRIAVAGLMGVTISEAEAVVMVLDPVLGEVVWTQTLPGAVYNIEQLAGWLTIADDDDVILGTRTWESGTGYDLVLHRFDAADGAEVWHQRWNSGGATADDPRCMVADPTSGDLLVAGVSDGDYLVARFDAGTGAPVWQAGYAGPPDWYDVATCLTVGPDGTVVASGFSDGSGTGWDVATVAFDPTDGAELWAVRFDGHGQSDEARAVTLGPDGRVYVTGYVYSYETGSDLLALCYETAGATAAPDDVPGRLAVTEAWPNPFNPRVTVGYAVPRDGHATLTVHDLRGRLVAELAAGAHTAGAHAVVWDGTDRGGRPLASGTYLAVLRSGAGRASWKLTLSK